MLTHSRSPLPTCRNLPPSKPNPSYEKSNPWAPAPTQSKQTAATYMVPHRIVSETISVSNTTSLDILVNNSGLGSAGTLLEDVTAEEYAEVMDVNLRAVIFMTQAFIRNVGRGGRIVKISSISARGGYATQSVYAASKAAVEGLTRVWATELGHRYGVTVNAVNPGPVDTDMYRGAVEVHLARMEEQNKKTPAAPRAGTESDVADVVVFLCEERSRWVTGDIVSANGGMLFI